jgi:hypothetical protein
MHIEPETKMSLMKLGWTIHLSLGASLFKKAFIGGKKHYLL